MQAAQVAVKGNEQRAALHLCSITLTPHSNPVASPDGLVFESANITQLCRRTGLNPITGRPLSPHQLIPLIFTLDPLSRRFRCPVLRQIFDGTVKVVIIATTGRVYSHAAVQKLNLQPRTLRDLVDNTPFTLDDIIVAYDPEKHVWLPSDFDVMHQPISHVSYAPHSSNTSLPSPPLLPRHGLSPNASTASLPSLSARGIVPSMHFKSPPPHPANSTNEPIPAGRGKPHLLTPDSNPLPARLSPPSSLLDPPQRRPLPSTGLHSDIVPAVPSQVSQTYHNPLETSRQRDPYTTEMTFTDMNIDTFSPYPSASTRRYWQSDLNDAERRPAPKSPLTKKPRFAPHLSAAPQAVEKPVDPQVSMARFYQRKKEEEQRKLVYKRVRKGKKGKGYVRVVTNIGHLNIELHCDRVPTTCDNFLTLAERKYYDGLTWHRVVPGFIAQTGDPTGRGDGGDSAWGGHVKDEVRTNLNHDAPGIVSMANSGRDTNRSQWFICFDAAAHLDGTHTVFGKVVGGLYVLQKMETEAEMGHPLTVERIEVLVNPIRQARLQMEKSMVHSAITMGTTESGRLPSPQANIVSNVPPSALEQRHTGFTPLYQPQGVSNNRPIIDEPNTSPQVPRISHSLPSIRSLINTAPISPSRGGCPPPNM